MHNTIWYFLLFLFILSGCNGEKAFKERINATEEEYGINSFQSEIAYMSYIYNSADDLDYSIELVKKIISNKNFTQARYALERLLIQYDDYQLFYLMSVCYRNQNQFDDAEHYIRKAMQISDSDILSEELEIIKEEKLSWEEIEKVNEQIKKTGLTPGLRLQRAEKLLFSGNREAAFLDLDTLISRGIMIDSSYNLKLNAYLNIRDYVRADSVARNWLAITDPERKSEIDSISQVLEQINELRLKISQVSAVATDYVNLARAFVEMQDFIAAENTLQRGLIQFKDNINLSYGLLLVYLSSDQKEKALKTANELQERGVELPSEIEEYLKK